MGETDPRACRVVTREPDTHGWKAIADVFGVNERTARRWWQDNGMPVFHRRGRAVAFRDELVRWSNEQVQPGPPRARRARAA